MGRTVYWMNVSLDLFIERDVGEEGGGAWMTIGERVHRDFNARAERLALMIQGRTTYEIMERFWPAAANDDAQPDYMREYGRLWTAKPKVLVSNSRAGAPQNTRVVGGEGALDELALADPLRCDLLEQGRFDNCVLVCRYAVGPDRDVVDRLPTSEPISGT